jgi:hypothetical protein
LLAPYIEIDGLFPYLVHKLDRRLCTTIVYGLNNEELRKWVLTPCIAYCAKQRAKLRYTVCKRAPLDEHWQTMQAHCRRHGPGSIVVGITGTYDHWTCIRKVSDRTLILADSWTLNRLYRRNIATDNSAVHKLNPKDTFLISIERK